MQNTEDRFPGVKRKFADQSGDNRRHDLSLAPSLHGSQGSTGVREPSTSQLPAVYIAGYQGTSYAAIGHTLYVLPLVPPAPTQGALYITNVPSDVLAQGVYTFVADWQYAGDSNLFLLYTGNMDGYKIVSNANDSGAVLSLGSTVIASATTLAGLLSAVNGYVGYLAGAPGLTFQWYRDTLGSPVTTTVIPNTVIGGKLAFQSSSNSLLSLSDVARVSVTRVDSSLTAVETLVLGTQYSVMGGALHWLSSVVLETGQSLRVAYSLSTANLITGATLGFYTPVEGDHFVAVYCKAANTYGAIFTTKFTVYQTVAITVSPVQTEFGGTLSVTATGDVLGYQWLYSGYPCDPAIFGDTTGATLAAAVLGSYSVVVKSYFGDVTSGSALVVAGRPRITSGLAGAITLNYQAVYPNITHRDVGSHGPHGVIHTVPLDTWGWPGAHLDWNYAQFYGVPLSITVQHYGNVSYTWHRVDSTGTDETITSGVTHTDSNGILITGYTPVSGDFNHKIYCVITGAAGWTQTERLLIVSPLEVEVGVDIATGVPIDPAPTVDATDSVNYVWDRSGYPLDHPTVTSAVSVAPPLLTPMQLGVYSLTAVGAWCTLYQEYDVTVLSEGANDINSVAKIDNELINGPLPAGDNGVDALAAFVGMTLIATPLLPSPSPIQWWLTDGVTHTPVGISDYDEGGATLSFTPTQLESGHSIYCIAVTAMGGSPSALYDVYDLPISQAIEFGGLGVPMRYLVLRSDTGTGIVWLNNSLAMVATTPTFTPSMPGYYYALSTGPAGTIHAGPVMVTG